MKAKLNPGTFSEVEIEGTPAEIAEAIVALERGRLAPLRTTPVCVPSVWHGGCLMGGACQYPAVWMGVNPPPCEKCGQAAPAPPTWTLTLLKDVFPAATVTLNTGMQWQGDRSVDQDLWHGEGP